MLPHKTANCLHILQISYHPNILFSAELGLAEHFDFVMTSEESKAEKPNRQIFDMAMEKTKCSDPATAYHVGTSIDFDVSNFNSLNVFICASLPHFFLSLLFVIHMDDFTDLFQSQSRYTTLNMSPQPILNHHLNQYLATTLTTISYTITLSSILLSTSLLCSFI